MLVACRHGRRTEAGRPWVLLWANSGWPHMPGGIRSRQMVGCLPGLRNTPRPIRPPKIGLVLSSGGLRGAPYAGVWACLHSLGWMPNVRVIHGTSIGAQVGAAMVARPNSWATTVTAFLEAGEDKDTFQDGIKIWDRLTTDKRELFADYIQNWVVRATVTESEVRRGLRERNLKVGVVAAKLTRKLMAELDSDWDEEVDDLPDELVRVEEGTDVGELLRPRLVDLRRVKTGNELDWVFGSSAVAEEGCAAPVISGCVVADGCYNGRSLLPLFDIDTVGLDFIVLCAAAESRLLRPSLTTPNVWLRFTNGLFIDEDECSEPGEIASAIRGGFRSAQRQFAQASEGGLLPAGLTFDARRADKGYAQLASLIRDALPDDDDDE